MRILPFLVAIMLAALVHAFEPTVKGVFSQRGISIVDEVPAPETTLDKPGGDRVSLVDYKCQVAGVTLWATWCHVCKTEMPAVDASLVKLVVIASSFCLFQWMKPQRLRKWKSTKKRIGSRTFQSWWIAITHCQAVLGYAVRPQRSS